MVQETRKEDLFSGSSATVRLAPQTGTLLGFLGITPGAPDDPDASVVTALSLGASGSLKRAAEANDNCGRVRPGDPGRVKMARRLSARSLVPEKCEVGHNQRGPAML